MAYDSTTLEAQLTLIQTAINTALANPQPNWKVGQVSMNHSEYLKMLFEQQDGLIKQLKEIPSEVVVSHQNDVDELGHDQTEYINEDYQ